MRIRDWEQCNPHLWNLDKNIYNNFKKILNVLYNELNKFNKYIEEFYLKTKNISDSFHLKKKL